MKRIDDQTIFSSKGSQAFYTALIVFLFYFTNKTILYDNLISSYAAYFIPLFLLIIINIFNIIFLKKKLNVKGLIFCFAIITITLITSLFNNRVIANDMLFIVSILITYLLFNIFTREKFLLAFSTAIIVLSITSLIGNYILKPLAMSRILSFSIIKNDFGVPFYNMFLCFPLAWKGLNRNYGIFSEPGVFQIFLMTSIIIEFLFIKRKKNNIIIKILLITTMITTFSSAGILCMLLFLIIYFVMNIKSYNLNTKGIVVFIVCCVLLTTLIISNDNFRERILHSLFEKFFEDDYLGSAYIRFYTPVYLLITSFVNPFIGLSFNGAYNYIYDTYFNGRIVDITGTFLCYFAGLGLPVGMLITYYYYKFCKIISVEKKYTLLVFLVLFLASLTQNLAINFMFFIFVLIPFMFEEKHKNSNEINGVLL